MTRTHKPPIRTCVACRTSSDKRELIRIVRTPDGHVEVDPRGKANGRGAYLCANEECFETARQRRKLDSALKIGLREDDYDRLRRELDATRAALTSTRQGR